MDIKNNITKKINLLENDSLSSFMNHACQQHHDVYEVFYNFIKEVKPKRILEIGTSLGGFTVFLKICCDHLELKTNIRTYDVNGRSWYDDMIKDGIDVRVENIFSDDYKSMDNEVIQFIQQEGLTIVLCDGGNKKEEFNLISNYIKSGDIIMAHDYSPNTEYFKNFIRDKIWNWCEIRDSDIEAPVLKNKLEPFMSDEFQKVVWVCKIKK